MDTNELIRTLAADNAHRAPRVGAVLTMGLLVVLGATFLRGFGEVIGIAVVLVAIYLVLNVIVIGSSVWYLLTHPATLDRWADAVREARREMGWED